MKHEWSVLFCSSDRVDTFLPGLEKVGGFSMCSSPGMLKREGTLDLAVKHSEHPPAKWFHQKVRIARQFKLYPSTLISQCSLSITFCLPGNLFMICPWTPLCCFQSFKGQCYIVVILNELSSCICLLLLFKFRNTLFEYIYSMQYACQFQAEKCIKECLYIFS